MYIGSNAVDDIKIGLNSVDAVYLGGTQVWSAIPADVKAHIARVTADGGTVPNQASMVSMVKKLIAANLWNNCVFFGLPLGGVKKDGNQFVSKVYDLKANADLLQATGTAQPKYDTDGSLLYDGGDNIRSLAMLLNNPIAECTNSITVIIWAKIVSYADQSIMARNANTSTTKCWRIFNSNTTGQTCIYLYDSTGGLKKQFIMPLDFTAVGLTQISFTFDGNTMDGAVQGLLRTYINGYEVISSKSLNLNIANIANSTTPIDIGSWAGGGSNKLTSGSQTALHQIYNSTLTAEQILWNFNNIRPEGV